MKTHFIFSIFVFYSIFTSNKAIASANTSESCDQKDNLALVINDIFDLDDPNTLFLHRWANFFHIKTKVLRKMATCKCKFY